MIKLAVIGDPIEHSLSPRVHGAILDALRIEYTYEKVNVKKGGLEEFIKYAKDRGITGFNLTMPHKVDVIPYLDYMDREASEYASVNTVCVRDNKLFGYTTDGVGYELSLKRNGIEFKGSRVVILGAGGACRTILKKASESGAKSITILNRTIEKAEKIIAGMGENVKACGFDLTEVKNADILINATPLGMHGCGEFESLDFLENLPYNAFVSDLIYNPAQTKFLKRAKELGHKTDNGLSMLIFQAIVSQEYYLNRKLDIFKIYETVIERGFRC